MKATIDKLWDTCREIITFDNSEFERPASLSQLKKCENVIVGEKDSESGTTSVLIDDMIYNVVAVTVRHFGGSMRVLEIF